ncbi:MAG: protoporphyrinogen oxidase [Bacteroidetes bacterium]|jgi:putative membrane protein|nr:protoporphyrinogen oxidase [Bacteroidota bacterium]MDF2450960.1 protoporphyrinogen oxidase [Bacteroidota bacterium]
MDYLYIKALHVVFIVTWFAGLFYMVRLFIYTKEASEKEEPSRSILTAQLTLMQKKLWYIITWPSFILTLIFGPWMLYLNPAILTFPWMWLKLIFVGLLALYHLQCHAYYKQQQAGIFKPSSFKLRLFNELATVFLVAIVFLIIVRSTSGLVWGMIGLFIFASLLMGGVYIYKRQRQTMSDKEQKGNIPPETGSN